VKHLLGTQKVKWVSGASGEDVIVGKKQTVSTPIEDPQEDEDADENLPF
jgi:hypothetical protein